MEIQVHQNEVITEDDIIGVFESENTTGFLDIISEGGSYDEPMSWYPDNILRVYINLSEHNTQYFRRVYTLLDAFGDTGGLLEAIMTIASILVIPCYFKIQPLHYYHGFAA